MNNSERIEPVNTVENKTELDTQHTLEQGNLIPMKVKDERDPSIMDLNLNQLVDDLHTIRTYLIEHKSLYRFDERITEKFQKYAWVGAAEGNDFQEALKEAKAIEITATSGGKFDMGRRLTMIDIKVVTSETMGYSFTFKFQGEKYYNASWRRINLEKTLQDKDVQETATLPIEVKSDPLGLE